MISRIKKKQNKQKKSKKTFALSVKPWNHQECQDEELVHLDEEPSRWQEGLAYWDTESGFWEEGLVNREEELGHHDEEAAW